MKEKRLLTIYNEIYLTYQHGDWRGENGCNGCK
jgi:hypothetical protein